MAAYNQYGSGQGYGGQGRPGAMPQNQQQYMGYAGSQYNMSSNQGGHPSVGATFYPGGSDDYYMPEVISPAPQRMMPKVPGNIQENIAHLELEGRQIGSPPVGGSPALDRMNSVSTVSSINTIRPISHAYDDHGQSQGARVEAPAFSPFPKLQNPPPNIPPTDEEKEDTLARARTAVLSSNDPDMQVTWAQDVLSYVEISRGEAQRNSGGRTQAQTPRIEHQLRVDALNVVSFLADQHHPQAEFMRGMWLEFGKFGNRIDQKEAFMCYTRSAERGYGRAEYRIGMQFENSNEPIKAIQRYNKGVDMGDSASHYRLGMMTLLGQHGQPQDFARAISLIRFSAENADENAPQGAYVFGMLQARELESISVPDVYLALDINGSRINIEKAAYLGFAKAQVKIGAAYELCQLGCEFKPALSLHYNALASRQGEPDADMAISKWFLCGYEGIFEKNDELAYKYAQRAANFGLPTAEFAMGYFHEVGINTPVNLDKAQSWYELAAKHGNKDATGRIESISSSNTLSRKDHEKVAIERIKSTYGSQRGARPERFKAQKPSMPTIPDSRLEMPDPSDRAGNSGYGNSLPRSSSAAPYPMEDMTPQGGYRQGVGGPSPVVRPSSAFQINPNLRSNTAQGLSHGNTLSPHPPQVGNPLPRPSTSMESLGGGGRGRSMAPANRGGRLVSNRPPPAVEYRAPGGPGTGLPPSVPEKGPSLTKLDIGFSAPPDASIDRKHRLQKQQAPTAGKPPPTQGTPLNPNMTRPSAASSPAMSSGFDADYRSPGTRLAHAPPEVLSRPQASTPGKQTRPDAKPASSNASKPPPKQSSSASSKPPKAGTAPPPPATPRPPGKGPKTFEEMGVPQGNKDTDCVVM